MIWGYRKFLAQKFIKKSMKFTKVLNYIKSSCIIYEAKMFGYYHYIYFLQEESIHFGQWVLKKFGLEVSEHFGPKKSQKKNQKNSQRFLNYTKSSYVPKCFDTFKSYTADMY